MRLRRRQRLSRQTDFAAVRNDGWKQHGPAFVFGVRKREAADLPRFAVVVSRRVGPAVMRNRLKRQMRAIFRERQELFPAGLDIVATMRPRAATTPFAELERQFLAAARKLGFREKEQAAGNGE